jgi:hypothetical protein
MAVGAQLGSVQSLLGHARRRRQRNADQVAQGIVLHALANPVTLAESFHVNDGPAHDPTIHFRICLTREIS